jgi:hypothetical protein
VVWPWPPPPRGSPPPSPPRHARPPPWRGFRGSEGMARGTLAFRPLTSTRTRYVKNVTSITSLEVRTSHSRSFNTCFLGGFRLWLLLLASSASGPG